MEKCIHFIGFRGEEYLSAVRVWGFPDFIHRDNDGRSREEISIGDTVIYGKKYKRTQYNWDASSYF